ncbi:hypothetical protein AVEN_203303-1 [Araneus ventricosus]|uniref:Uncharacterized protein n=1 Tax=Araneus ventricosus TaxID=182803 RepID=A0A4Y2CSN1_ARAVE|nr:hypothetical protein AVEN_47900-1 [Araneus ventricosus]GBM07401.1 hypothetical protein AVEN_203303-1 [Araneus ventricosus]
MEVQSLEIHMFIRLTGTTRRSHQITLASSGTVASEIGLTGATRRSLQIPLASSGTVVSEIGQGSSRARLESHLGALPPFRCN